MTGSTTGFRSAAGSALIIASSLILAWVLSLAASSAGRDWNARVDDSLFRLRYVILGPEKIERSIAHVDLTDSVVDELGIVNGDRRDFARLVRVLDGAGVSAILFDIIFPSNGSPQGDAAFAASLAQASTVYLPVIMRTVTLGEPGAVAPAREDNAFSSILWHPRVTRKGNPGQAASAVRSYAALSAAAKAMGAINIDPDPDGVYRRMPLVVRYSDGYVPSLALKAAIDILGVDPERVELAFGCYLRLPAAHLPDGSMRTIDIPVDGEGRMIIDYAGPWAKSFPHYSMAKILEAQTDPAVADSLASEMDGAYVIVSDLTTAASDYGAIPLEREYPRSGIHASILNSILSNRFLRDSSWTEDLVLTLAFAALLWAATWRPKPLAGTLLSLLAWVVLVAAEFCLFLFLGILPRLAGPTLGFVLALVVVNAWRFLQAERDRLHTRARMERYFAPRLLSRILQDKDRLFSAEQKLITILFSDISGFTSWCTTQPPDSVHRTLNEYFEQMSEIVFRNEGTIDKFIGDGLMAFFGDPLPQPDHALRAVRTGIEMQQAVRQLRARWAVQGRMPIHIRVGINSGEVVVGDMGSQRIMAYTAIGSSVNLASRLEGKAPVDGVLVSAPVYHAVKDVVAARFAGRITAKGISEEFETYEIVVPS